MPNHNYGRYIEKAVDSILSQTISDWELIIIDDGSTDNSIALLEKYKSNPKIKIIEQENKGLNITNNVAIRLARGKYIVRVDADDFIDENFLLVLANTLDQKPDIGLVYPDFYHIDLNGNIIETVRRQKIESEVELLDLPAHGACTMFRHDILLNLGSYNEDFSCQDGYDIWIRFIEKYKPYNINVPLFYYRQHGVSLTKNEHKILDTRREIKKTFIKNKGGIKRKVIGFIPVIMASIYHQNRPFVELDGKPLLWYTLNEVQKTKYFDCLILSSESEEVLAYTKKHFPKIKALLRKKMHSGYEVKTAVIIKESMQRLGFDHYSDDDAICILPISTPLRKIKHIEHAIDTMEVFKVDTILAIQEEFSPCYQHDRFGLKPINITNEGGARLERYAIYKSNGSITLTRLEYINKGLLYGKKVGHITMLPEESVKLNSNYEYWLAEQLIRKNK
jgi:glycosyltransferase involved in cell wall biosynthesis